MYSRKKKRKGRFCIICDNKLIKGTPLARDHHENCLETTGIITEYNSAVYNLLPQLTQIRSLDITVGNNRGSQETLDFNSFPTFPTVLMLGIRNKSSYYGFDVNLTSIAEKFPNLKRLTINGFLDNIIPSEIGSLVNLEFLELQTFGYELHLPESFGDLSQLEELHLKISEVNADMFDGIIDSDKAYRMNPSDIEQYYQKANRVHRMTIPESASKLPLERLKLGDNGKDLIVDRVFALIPTLVNVEVELQPNIGYLFYRPHSYVKGEGCVERKEGFHMNPDEFISFPDEFKKSYVKSVIFKFGDYSYGPETILPEILKDFPVLEQIIVRSKIVGIPESLSALVNKKYYNSN